MQITLTTNNGKAYRIKRDDDQTFIASLKSVAQFDDYDPYEPDEWFVWPLPHVEERIGFATLQACLDYIIAGWWRSEEAS